MAPWSGDQIHPAQTLSKRSTNQSVTIAVVLAVIAGVALFSAGYLIIRYLRPVPPSERTEEEGKRLPIPPPPPPPSTAQELSREKRSRVQSFQRMVKAVKIRSILFNKNKPLPPPPDEEKSTGDDITVLPIMFQRPRDDTLRSEDFYAAPPRLPKLESTTFSLPPVILRDGPDRLSSMRPTYPESPASSSFGLERLIQHPYGPRAVASEPPDSELAYNRMTRTSNFSYDESDWSVPIATTTAFPVPPPAVTVSGSLRRNGEIKYKPEGGGTPSRRPLPSRQDIDSSLADIPESVPSAPFAPSRLPVKSSTRSQLTSTGSFDISSYYRFSSTVPRLVKT